MGWTLVVNEYPGHHTNVTLIDQNFNEFTYGVNVGEFDFNPLNGFEGGVYYESNSGATRSTYFNISESTFNGLRQEMISQVQLTASGGTSYHTWGANCVDGVLGWLDSAGISYDPTTLFSDPILDGYSTGKYYLDTIYDWVRQQVDPNNSPNYNILNDIDQWIEDFWDGVNALLSSESEGEVAENEQDLRDNTVYSPIAIDLNGDGLHTTMYQQGGVNFDLNGDGTLDRTAWLSGDDGFLGIDLNNDGVVNSGAELFGGAQRGDGFSSLREYDTNNDGYISNSDASYSDLIIWQDINSDGVSTQNEIHSLTSLGISSIDLNYITRDEYDYGNLIGEHATASINGTQVAVGDIYFQADLAAA